MISLEGANCADLPPFVIDKYFDCNPQREPLRAMVARAICARCPVILQCRDAALNMPLAPSRGVIAGITAGELARARSWRRYEHGFSDRIPTRARPDWLPMTEAGQVVEQLRLETDPDE